MIRRDISNGKRLARRGEGGQVTHAFGFDLALSRPRNRCRSTRHSLAKPRSADWSTVSMRSAATRSALHAFRLRMERLSGRCSYCQGVDRETGENGRKPLAVHAREIDGLTSVPPLRGPRAAFRPVRRRAGLHLSLIGFQDALVIARCVEALAAAETGHTGHAFLHIDHPDAPSGASARWFRTAVVQAGATGTVSLP
ncbi:helix-turn-helix domain-containing protein [Methylobacterium indicum]|uniref:helix-turn-helix domain-containing protein n=1 Tax=Methylobacterium indicum TaxID=1775910 RepID=UPI001A90EDC4